MGVAGKRSWKTGFKKKGNLNHERKKIGAGNGIRTRDFNLGKVTLYH